jgi:hypothetical protein
MVEHKKMAHIFGSLIPNWNSTKKVTEVSVTKKVIRKVTCLMVIFLNKLLKLKFISYAF